MLEVYGKRPSRRLPFFVASFIIFAELGGMTIKKKK